MKIKELQRYMQKRRIDFCLLYNLDHEKKDANIFYFTGYKGIGALIISKKKRYLIVPEMEYERAKKCRIKIYKWKKENLFELIKKLNKKSKKAGIDKERFTLKLYNHFKKQFKKSKDISEICLKLREIKTKEEIKIIRKACKITDDILKKCFRQFNRFKTELDVANFLENEIKKNNCEIAFKPIVASGKNSSMPHYEPKNTKLKKGFCIIDFGVRYKEYNSDITRTVYIGKPEDSEIEAYNLLLKTYYAVIKSIKIKSKCGELVKTAKKSLGEYERYFIHGLGHGLGLDVHELPNLKEKSKDLLKKGMVFSVEPGIYFPKRFGIRIEDDILLNKNKEALTKTTKNLFIFKRK